MIEPRQSKINWGTVIVAILTAIIAAIPPTLMALAAFKKSGETHDLVNSRMTELLELTRVNAAAKATAIEKRAESDRKRKTTK